MSTKPAGIKTIIVDTVSLLPSVIDAAVIGLRPDVPSLFIDLEGIKLSRHGSISIMSLYVAPRKTVYLIDIYKLKNEAFSTVNRDGESLKSILQSPVILKVLFDVRNDSDALFSLYGISIDGIRDVQLMELGTRKGSKYFLASLDKCVKNDSTISATEKEAWGLTKGNTRQLFDPALGGRNDIFNERPIQPVIVKYCAGDVTLLPDLFSIYETKLNRPGEEFWKLHVLDASKERIRLSQSSEYDGTSKSNAHGPWTRDFIEEAMGQWNDDILDNAYNCEEDGWEDDGPTNLAAVILLMTMTMNTTIQTRV